MKFLPAAKSKRWFLWMTVYAILLWLLFPLHRFVMLAQEMDTTLLLRFALFSVVVAGIVNTLGWLGARLLWVFSTAGIIIGAAFMLGYTYKEMSGWEDLAGFLAFSLFSCAGFALGLLAEGIRLLYTRASKS
ncbi:hypothetical protein NSQ91_06245 [Paenibacillus sp. FSL R7-0048]|jgi:glucan phosphoethanolaminetransferase (alkaline phosphatase superfamily)|uniref:hypothetical protein n=1 Tax=Paenibacillus TaxID=44249 RepID=UPI00096FA609|nr:MULTISPECIES: hypothetical protein [Paenibacillus]MDH6425685.1 glucan phosphoethanolaminetransferase (alkaline phosphatase superfamily) [Paenibacillus sp. PastH-4]MDH6441705.1 glucan phosphoethanolaminetransferase (alkaline phosphatase superfamily) [Paenibacillus sp. PastF-4]MDH6529784.1 glucan phosphoethanolaminetransferase (alkaline phosphatase superfamily) [Paenibacillus sp. PastH-3]OMD56465.1 hypothetical protein BSK55_21350 [Paenibacillus odorifer]OMD65903.1 hypothetical protein BSK62_